jgi:hypothetical protein
MTAAAILGALAALGVLGAWLLVRGQVGKTVATLPGGHRLDALDVAILRTLHASELHTSAVRGMTRPTLVHRLESTGQKASASRIDPKLYRLERLGLVSAEWWPSEPREGEARRSFWALTEAGLRALHILPR